MASVAEWIATLKARAPLLERPEAASVRGLARTLREILRGLPEAGELIADSDVIDVPRDGTGVPAVLPEVAPSRPAPPVEVSGSPGLRVRQWTRVARDAVPAIYVADMGGGQHHCRLREHGSLLPWGAPLVQEDVACRRMVRAGQTDLTVGDEVLILRLQAIRYTETTAYDQNMAVTERTVASQVTGEEYLLET